MVNCRARISGIKWLGMSIAVAALVGCSPIANDDDDDDAATISGTISRDSTFSNTGIIYQVSTVSIEANVVFAANTHYVVSGYIRIAANGTLTIKPGCRLEFASGAYLSVGESSSGTLIAEGTAADSIFFVPSVSGTVWGYGSGESSSGGIYIDENSTSNTSLKYCSITKATTGVYAAAPGITISNCGITQCTYHGIYFASGGSPADSSSFVNNTITGNGWYAVSISAAVLHALSGTGKVAGNAKGGIFVRGDDAGETGSWKKHDAPYTVDGAVHVGSTSGNTITIRPGVVFEMNDDAYIGVGEYSPGTLIADGTATDSIVFRPKVAGTNWGYGTSESSSGGIYVDERSTSNTSFKYCSITRATTGIFADASITVSNCRIGDCQFHGIYFSSGGAPKDSASFVNNTITANGEYAISMTATYVSRLSGTGTVAGNTRGGIFVRGDHVDATGAWKKHDASYTVDGHINIGSAGGNTLTIRPGVVLEFTPDAYIGVGEYDPGTLIAEGTAADSIFFKPKVSGTFWGYGTSETTAGGIYIDAYASANTSLRYCSIQKSTNGVYITDISPAIKNCRIAACQFYGIFIYTTSGATTANFADNDLTGNTMGEILQQ